MGYQAALIALSALAVLLLIPPFIWHIKTLNIPLITLICWLLLMNLKIFVDAIIWGGSDFMTRYDGVGYCDVMVKLQVGANVGISSSVAGVMYNLYKILKADSAIPAPRSFKKVATDLSISLLTPVVVMALNYLVQTRRYYILQYSGCQNVTSLTWVTVIVYSMWMVVWSLVGVVFAIMIIIIFFRKRKDVRDILKCTNSGLNIVRFSKLLSFCCVIILVMFPLSMYIFTDGIGRVQQNYSFSLTHSPAVWNLISFVPLSQPYYTTWIYLALSYVVFIFFGLGSDAIEMYLEILSKVGLSPLVEWIKKRRVQKKINKADKLVNGVLNVVYMSSPSSNGTAFDIEMQKAMEDDDKSPVSVNVSNVFADKNAINDQHFKYLSGLSESMFEDLDDEDIKYLNMLYENDKQVRSSSYQMDLHDHSPTLASNSPGVDDSAESEIGYSYVVKQKHAL
jgi:pheromone a factor receptor